MRSFKKGVAEELGFYVYRLIDPRNGQTFYVGKGRGDRVFAHINDELALGENEEERSMKLETIREIRRARLPPVHVIHRHGMKEEVAIEVEATLIDVFAGGLTNVAVGQDSNRRGPANAAQLDAHYAAEVLEPMPGHRLMYIKIRQDTADSKGLYEAVRRSWQVNRKEADKAEYVLAVINQIVRGVFTDCKWKESSEDIPSAKGKSEFVGREVFGEIADQYVGKLIPPEYRKRGMAGAWFYSWTGADEETGGSTAT